MAEPRHRRILVITTEPLPLPDCDTTGAGLRAWGLALGLRSHGLDVTVATPCYPDSTLPDPPPACVAYFRRGHIAPLIARTNPDAVILQHWGIAREIPELSVPLAIDLAGPHLLERHYWGNNDPDADLEEKLAALRRADFVVCSGPSQRLYFLPFLMMAGFDITATALPVIPFSVAPDPPPAAPPSRDAIRFVYSGTVLAWQDPSNPIRWLLEELDRSNRGSLIYIGGGHPVLDASGRALSDVTELLDKHPRVTRRGRMPFDTMMQELAGCSVALDLMARNPERELAFASRTMVYLRAGLPVIHNDFADTAEVIRRHGAGWTLSPDDEDAFRSLIRRILSGAEPLDSPRAGARQAADAHSWDTTVEPLAAWCHDPRPRPGKTARALSHEARISELLNLRQRVETLEHDNATIRGKFAVRLSSRLSDGSFLLRPLVWLAAWPLALLVFLRLRSSCRDA